MYMLLQWNTQNMQQDLRFIQRAKLLLSEFDEKVTAYLMDNRVNSYQFLSGQ